MIVVDTHAFIWWFGNRDLLSARAREALDTNPIQVATITCFEIVRLVERSRFDPGMDVGTWLENIFALPHVTALPLTMDIAVTAATLPEPIRDPIDRIIVATALLQRVPLVTKDHKIIAAGVVPTIW